MKERITFNGKRLYNVELVKKFTESNVIFFPPDIFLTIINTLAIMQNIYKKFFLGDDDKKKANVVFKICSMEF